MRLQRLLFAVLIVGLIAMTAGCGPVEDAQSAKMTELKETNRQLEERINEQDEIIQLLVKSSWRYEILVNSKPITGESTVHVSQGSFEVALTERIPPVNAGVILP